MRKRLSVIAVISVMLVSGCSGKMSKPTSQRSSSAKTHKCVASAVSNRFGVRADINVLISDHRRNPTKSYRNVKLPWTSPDYRCTQATVMQVNVTRKRGGKTVSCFIHVDNRQVRSHTSRSIAYCAFDDVPPARVSI